MTPEKARELVQWLQKARPEAVNTDEMQTLFGGKRSFDWAIAEEFSSPGPYPAFQPYGTAVEEADA